MHVCDTYSSMQHRHLADLHKLMVIAVVESPNPRDIVILSPVAQLAANKYHHVDR